MTSVLVFISSEMSIVLKKKNAQETEKNNFAIVAPIP